MIWIILLILSRYLAQTLQHALDPLTQFQTDLHYNGLFHMITHSDRIRKHKHYHCQLRHL